MKSTILIGAECTGKTRTIVEELIPQLKDNMVYVLSNKPQYRECQNITIVNEQDEFLKIMNETHMYTNVWYIVDNQEVIHPDLSAKLAAYKNVIFSRETLSPEYDSLFERIFLFKIDKVDFNSEILTLDLKAFVLNQGFREFITFYTQPQV